MTRRLVKNAARCLLCDTVVESRSVHDWRQCPCQNVFVDGGLEYLRLGVAQGWDTLENLCEWEGEDD